ncbi:MAG: sigma-70 family RNA polymerase sigma factor [Planctomycetota bacterium]|nr:sigma-70 family RNA polymerase sigma factor [Planctomycetota bacterium]
MGDRPSEESLLGHADFIRRLARRLVLDEHRAEDVTQEVLLAAIRKPPPAGARLGAWLGVVARNLALRERRSTHRRQERELRAARPEGGDSVAETVARLETQRLLVDAVLLLDEPYRSTVVQRFLDGRSAEEIARLTGTPVETVRTRIKRALRRLRARLAGDHDGDRRASLVALLPLAGWKLNGKVLPSALATGGALLMTAKTKLFITAALLLLAAAFIVPMALEAQTDELARDRTAREVGAVTPEAAPAVSEPTHGTAEPVVGRPAEDWPFRVYTHTPGAEVTLKLRYYGSSPDPEPLVKTADTSGFAGFELPEHKEPLFRADVEARAKGHGWRFSSPDISGTARFKLTEGVPIRGRVLSEHGGPVAGAEIQVGQGRKWRADSNGNFQLVVPRKGNVTLWVRHRGHLEQEIRTTAPGEDLVVTLDRGLSISGRVVIRGMPMPGVWVRAGNKGDYARTDEEGRYTLWGLEPGDVHVYCRMSGHPRSHSGSRFQITKPAGSSDADFTGFTLHLIRVSVVDEDGLPFRHAKITATARNGITHHGWAQEDGRFSAFVSVWKGKVVVSAKAPGLLGRETVGISGTHRAHGVRIVMRPVRNPGWLVLNATDDRDTPLGHVVLTLSDDGNALTENFIFRRVDLDARGHARVDGVPPGRYRVMISEFPAHYTVEGYWLTVYKNVEILPGAQASLSVAIVVGGRVRVTVRDLKGTMLAPGRVVLKGASGYETGVRFGKESDKGSYSWGISDPVPAFSLTTLWPGRYTIEAVGVTREVTIERGKTTDIEIVLNR